MPGSLTESLLSLRPVASFLPSQLRVALVLFGLAVLYRVNGNVVKVWDSFGVMLFPTFYIAYVAVVAPEFLNVVQSNHDPKHRPRDGFLNELKTLKTEKLRTIFIFAPLYITLTYMLNRQTIHEVLGYVRRTV